MRINLHATQHAEKRKKTEDGYHFTQVIMSYTGFTALIYTALFTISVEEKQWMFSMHGLATCTYTVTEGLTHLQEHTREATCFCHDPCNNLAI